MEKITTLMSLSDFVTKVEETETHNESDLFNQLMLIINYNKFLSQPLTLGMFIPCDEEGNVLENPIQDDLCSSFFEKQQSFNQEKEYESAKSKVLFEGVPHTNWLWNLDLYPTLGHIADISSPLAPVKLSESALKQIYG